MSSSNKYTSNIKKIYAFSFFWMFLVIIPVIVPFFVSLGFNMREIFQLQAVYGLAITLFELPSGYLSDIWGRKKVLCIGSLMSGLGFSLLSFINSFNEFVIYEILLGISASLVSGTDISILYDSLDYKSNDRADRTQAMGQRQFFSTISESMASVLGGFLAVLSFHTTVVVQSIVSWIPFLIALTINEPPSEKMEKNQHRQNFKLVINHLFFSDKLIRLIFFNMIIWSLATYIASWTFQKYWQENQISVGKFGLIWASYLFCVGMVGKQIHSLEKRWGPVLLIIVMAALPIIGYSGMSLVTGILAPVLGVTFQVTRGINQVLLGDAFNWRIKSSFRTTANSFTSLFFRLSFCLVGPLIGYSYDRFGLQNSLLGISMIFFMLAIIFTVPLVREVRVIKPEMPPSR